MSVDGNTIKELEKLLKAPYILLTLALCSGLLLFLPDFIVKKMYLLDFRDKFGGIIGVIFLISLCLLLTLLCTKIYSYARTITKRKKDIARKKKYLLKLEENKAKVIKNLLKAPTHTMPMQYNNGVTMELVSYGVISQAGSTQAMEFGYDNEIILKYFLQPWVAELINKDEQLKEKYKKSK